MVNAFADLATRVIDVTNAIMDILVIAYAPFVIVMSVPHMRSAIKRMALVFVHQILLVKSAMNVHQDTLIFLYVKVIFKLEYKKLIIKY